MDFDFNLLTEISYCVYSIFTIIVRLKNIIKKRSFTIKGC